ncbi:gamma-glutamyl hydrolase-like [Coccinella septempunctata]|uniref:gamma-glutamyl hydrolase-like n=1 Tax=Coccinella septempunctata TaxID=41139 RepID=UPI001D082721|nr:gamma-glutamyl hydrolase-like [Coccinella septempunctata]
MRWIFYVFCLLLRINFLGATETPIVGILALEPYGIQKFYPNLHISSYISASYVKFLESSGARVIPVWIGQSLEYYERVVRFTNGMLFPGGATYFNESKGYAEAAKIIFRLAEELNDRGIYYPLIGICLGMQVLAFASAGGKDIRIGCDAMKVSLPLEFDPNYSESRVFKDTPKEILSDLRDKNVTYNYHKYCLTDEVLNDNNLTDIWRIVTRNDDIHGKKFISIMEHKKYPFYGFQFHPEKSKFEFQERLMIPHDLYNRRVSQFFADFTVGECSKNNNTFPDRNIEHRSLIYNFNVVLGPINCSYLQLYLFTDSEPAQYQLV